MMVMTAKVDLKKILLILAGISLLLLVGIYLLGRSSPTAVSANDSRVEFLKNQGWEVALSPTDSSLVRIPKEESEVFTRYNELQKLQGFDLSRYAGKQVTRYVYKITNYPDATEPVYATLLVYKNRIIGADITDTAPGGKLQPLVRKNPAVQ